MTGTEGEVDGMSWVTYYIEVSSRQHEDERRRQLTRPHPTLERIPKQRSEKWRRLWGRPWSRPRSSWAARLTGRNGRRAPAAGRTAGPVSPASH